MNAVTPAISVRDLRKVYLPMRRQGERVVAVERLDLDIARGEIFGLIGPNGAGKTTLLRMLATLLPPTHGEIRIAGYDSEAEREEVCRCIGFMPETFSLYEEMKVWEYLEFFAAAYGARPDERQKTLDAILELTDLGVRRDSFTGTLSKGMRQRVLLAKTLVHDPEVLILDEPTDGLDPHARIEFRNILLALRRMGKTILISSHILSDLSLYCTSVGIMEGGRLLVSGTIEEVRRALAMKAEVELTFLPDGAEPVAILSALPQVSEPRLVAAGRVQLHFDGRAETKAIALAALVRGGVRVVEFRERPSSLEEILLQVGAMRVQ